jgi:hypothetical protein
MGTVTSARADVPEYRCTAGMNRGTMPLRIHPSPNDVSGATGAGKESPMIGVVEWIAPVRNTSWVAACFGTVDR